MSLRFLLPLFALGLLLSSCSFLVQDDSETRVPVPGHPRMVKANLSGSTLSFLGEIPGVLRHEGRFTKYEFTLKTDAYAEPATTELVVTVASLVTDNPKLTEDLLSEDFFFEERFALASFRSTEIEPLGGDLYRITGALKLRGLVKTISFDAVITDTKLSADAVIDATRFDIGKNEEELPKEVQVHGEMLFTGEL